MDQWGEERKKRGSEVGGKKVEAVVYMLGTTEQGRKEVHQVPPQVLQVQGKYLHKTAWYLLQAATAFAPADMNGKPVR